MGKGEKEVRRAVRSGDYSSSEDDMRKVNNPGEVIFTDDDEEANEDLSLKIVQKSLLRTVKNDPSNDGVSEIVMNLKEEKKKKKERKKKKSIEEIEVLSDSPDIETDKDKLVTDKAIDVSLDAVETNPVESADNAVMRKLLRGVRYFDPPDNNSWGACYNCGEEDHTTVNCTYARRKKPCFVCGSFEHNAKQCSKGRDCFICKEKGHRARNCPEKNKSSKICLKCGDPGHDMFSCRNDYHPDDLKEIQCYVCGQFGHLCCKSYTDPGPQEVTCYRCGLSGHTGLACAGVSGDRDGLPYNSNSCYKCGLEGHFARECTSSLKAFAGVSGDRDGLSYNSNLCYKCGLEGHFARECTNSVKRAKRNRDPSTPKQRSSKKESWKKVKSAPHDLGKIHRKKKSRYPDTSAVKPKRRGGWITEDPESHQSHKMKANHWRSPKTPIDIRRSKFSTPNGDYASSSRSPKKPRKLNFNNSSNGSSVFHQHRFSASRFSSSNSKDGMGRNYNWW